MQQRGVISWRNPPKRTRGAGYLRRHCPYP